MIAAVVSEPPALFSRSDSTCSRARRQRSRKANFSVSRPRRVSSLQTTMLTSLYNDEPSNRKSNSFRFEKAVEKDPEALKKVTSTCRPRRIKSLQPTSSTREENASDKEDPKVFKRTSSLKFSDKSPRPSKAPSLRMEQRPRSLPLAILESESSPRSPASQKLRLGSKRSPPQRERTVSSKKPLPPPDAVPAKGCLKYPTTATAESTQESTCTQPTQTYKRPSGCVCFDERVLVRKIPPISWWVAHDKLWYTDEDYAFFQRYVVKLIHFALDVSSKGSNDLQKRHFPGLEKWIVALTAPKGDDDSDDAGSSCESIQWVLTAQSMQVAEYGYIADEQKIAEMYQALTMQSQMEAFERAQEPKNDQSVRIWL